MESKERREKILNVICKSDFIESQEKFVNRCIKKGYGQKRTIQGDIEFLERVGLVTSKRFGSRKAYNAFVPDQMPLKRKQKMLEILGKRIEYVRKELEELDDISTNTRKQSELKKRAYELGLLIDTTIQVFNWFASDPTRWRKYEEQIEDFKIIFIRLGLRLFSHLGRTNQPLAKEVFAKLVIR